MIELTTFPSHYIYLEWNGKGVNVTQNEHLVKVGIKEAILPVIGTDNLPYPFDKVGDKVYFVRDDYQKQNRFCLVFLKDGEEEAVKAYFFVDKSFMPVIELVVEGQVFHTSNDPWRTTFNANHYQTSTNSLVSHEDFLKQEIKELII
jgi:hypothetical protein